MKIVSYICGMEDKRENIIQKALELYGEFGIKSVSMDDIARGMGMSKKTLYQFINDKNELIKSVIDYYKNFVKEAFMVFHYRKFNAIEQFFEFRNLVNPVKSRYQPTFYYDMNKYYPTLLQEIKDEKLKVVEAAMLANLKQGKEEGYYNEDINEHLISRVMVSYHLYTLDLGSGMFTEAELQDEKTFEEVFKYHFRGVCTPKGMEELHKLFCSTQSNTQ